VHRGDVYVIHSGEDGEPEKRTFWEVTYRIPLDGILRTQTPLNRGFTRTTYYYEHRDGTLERIRHQWRTTIHRIPVIRVEPIGRREGAPLQFITF
jgi:uncharacterized protein DUF6843